jgi:predicted lysophospholipase L1 biosynthesis ABC-type transport system permease subunit
MRQRIRDVTGDVLDGLLARPVRALLLIVVFAIGCGGFVAATGVSRSAAHQITQTLTPSDLDHVVVREQRPGDLPEDAERRAGTIARAAGTVYELDPGAVSIAVLPRIAGRPRVDVSAPVYGADQAWLRLQEPRPATVSEHLGGPAGDHTAVVGQALADRLHLATPGPGVKIWLDETPFDVVGTITSASRNAALREAVVIDSTSARAISPTATAALLVLTREGAAGPVSTRIALALRPDHPTALTVDPVLDIEQLRRGVDTDLDRSIAVVSALVLAFATVGSGNAMVVAVIGRTGEIGLRRALGASRKEAATIFLAEGAITGTAGGLLGSALGLLTVLLTAALRGWTPVIDVFTVPLGPVIGLAVGVLAAVYPALRAASIQPAAAVRHTG